LLITQSILISGNFPDSGEIFEWGQGPVSPRLLDYYPAVELEALVIKPSRVSVGKFHTIIHAGPHERTQFTPTLTDEELSVVKDAIHARLAGNKRVDLKLLQVFANLILIFKPNVQFFC
jgi:hypothetical protein